MSRRRRRPDEQGLTLIELVVTVAILGIAFVALVGGLAAAVAGSTQQRRRAATDAALRTAAENVRATAYVDCAPGYDPPVASGFTASATVTGFWNAEPAENRFEPPPCPAGVDSGLQLVELTVTSGDGRVVESVEVVKRR